VLLLQDQPPTCIQYPIGHQRDETAAHLRRRTNTLYHTNCGLRCWPDLSLGSQSWRPNAPRPEQDYLTTLLTTCQDGEAYYITGS